SRRILKNNSSSNPRNSSNSSSNSKASCRISKGNSSNNPRTSKSNSRTKKNLILMMRWIILRIKKPRIRNLHQNRTA
ncbi:MAG: hypothetical protein D4S01_10850, partial [Dehalococcoidia bacterium]